MVIDSHVHMSFVKKRKNFSEIRDDLLLNMRKNKIDYSIIIPDNTPNSQCADLETVIDLINSLNITNEEKDKIFYKNSLNLFRLK